MPAVHLLYRKEKQKKIAQKNKCREKGIYPKKKNARLQYATIWQTAIVPNVNDTREGYNPIKSIFFHSSSEIQQAF